MQIAVFTLFKRLTMAFLIMLAAGCDVNSRNDPKALKEQLDIAAPSGKYVNDPTHSTLQFSLSHLGLSNYIARFSDYSVEMSLKADEIAASKVIVDINSQLIKTDYRGDYKFTHPKSSFDSWEEDLAFSEKFFNATIYPRIIFKSSKVSYSPNGDLRITGNLTLLGQTRPVVLSGKIIGSIAKHPFTERGAIGFSVSGTFERSSFGMDFLLDPPLIGDDVTVTYEGEMLQVPQSSDSQVKSADKQ